MPSRHRVRGDAVDAAAAVAGPVVAAAERAVDHRHADRCEPVDDRPIVTHSERPGDVDLGAWRHVLDHFDDRDAVIVVALVDAVEEIRRAVDAGVETHRGDAGDRRRPVLGDVPVLRDVEEIDHADLHARCRRCPPRAMPSAPVIATSDPVVGPNSGRRRQSSARLSSGRTSIARSARAGSSVGRRRSRCASASSRAVPRAAPTPTITTSPPRRTSTSPATFSCRSTVSHRGRRDATTRASPVWY